MCLILFVVYFGLPEANIPTLDLLINKSIEEINGSTNETSNFGDDKTAKLQKSSMMRWNKMVLGAVKNAETDWLIMAKTAMRERLLEEALELTSVDERLDAIRELVPPSVERNILVANEIEKELTINGYIDAEILEKNRPQIHEETCDILTKLLINSIAFYPGAINTLVNVLDGKIEIADAHANGAEVALSKIQKLYQDLTPQLRAYVLQTAIDTTIASLPSLPRIDGIEPFDLYVKAIDEGLIEPLRYDARYVTAMVSSIIK